MRVGPGHTPSRPARAATSGPGGQRPVQRADGPGIDAEELATLLTPVITAAGLDLESVRVTAAGRRRLLRIVVDADDGVSLDDIAEVSRDISRLLDAGDAMGEAPYTLEVSSPGIERPLTEPRHWRRARGRLVTIPLATAVPAPPAQDAGAAATTQATVTGRVVAASETGITLDIEGDCRRFTYTELGPGKVQVEFSRGGSPDGH
jgi:ribosome maturation factor RimP